MKMFSSWDAFNEAVGRLPEADQSICEILRVEGYFWTVLKRGKVSPIVPIMVHSLERMMKQAFPYAEIIGLESPQITPYPDRQRGAYNGMFIIATSKGGMGYVDVKAGYPEYFFPSSDFLSPAIAEFSLKLPGGEYRNSSKRLLEALWPAVRGIYGTVPILKDTQIPKHLIGDILLTNQEKYLASGYMALEKIGFSHSVLNKQGNNRHHP